MASRYVQQYRLSRCRHGRHQELQVIRFAIYERMALHGLRNSENQPALVRTVDIMDIDQAIPLRFHPIRVEYLINTYLIKIPENNSVKLNTSP